MSQPFRILSIDGGGIRGVIPARVLMELEQLTGKPTAQMFDLIAGTSTGGILALALSIPGEDGAPKYSAADVLGLYRDHGQTIFPTIPLRTLKQLASELYPAEGLESVLAEYFGDARLKDAVTNVLVTSYEIELRQPFFFRSSRARESARFDYLMREAARATSAAPTYFEPAKVTRTDRPDDFYALIDGGVFANNPTMCAIVDARAQFDRGNDVLIVSLGTGSLVRPVPYAKSKDWGVLGWSRPLIDILMDGVSATVDYQVQQLYSGRYHRLQADLLPEHEDMDDATPDNVRALLQIGDRLVDKCHTELATIAARLKPAQAAATTTG